MTGVASELRRFDDGAGGAAPGAPALAVACLAWRLPRPMLVASTASVGGGIGARDWVLNVQVPMGYARRDIDAHVAEVAAALSLVGAGVGMLTAAGVDRVAVGGEEDGVRVEATVGVSIPVWAAAPPDTPDGSGWARHEAGAGRPGTINVVAFVPVRHTDAALANLLCTVTEAKVQALRDGGVPGTGTASDAVTVVCPAEGPAEPFGGPRAAWGAPVARAVYGALRTGLGSLE
ncbi:MAG TPA: adenosylcobinamide amidohydrolase [Acidimicrobiales bacterium]